MTSQIQSSLAGNSLLQSGPGPTRPPLGIFCQVSFYVGFMFVQIYLMLPFYGPALVVSLEECLPSLLYFSSLAYSGRFYCNLSIRVCY